jgi:nitroreductase
MPLIKLIKKRYWQLSAVMSLSYTFIYFWVKYLRYSGCVDPMNQNEYRGVTRLLLLCHSLEKGISFRRNGGRSTFGQQKFEEICRLEKRLAFCLAPKMRTYLQDLKVRYKNECVAKHSSENETINIHQDFLINRKSIRNYADKHVKHTIIEECLVYAEHAPTVCNRQNIHILNLADSTKVRKLCELQGGNSGFTNIQGLLVVYADLRGYLYSKEMHQCFVDGGIALYSAILNLHALNLGSCPLAWMPTPNEERQALKLLDLSANYKIVALASYGIIDAQSDIVFSPRKLR